MARLQFTRGRTIAALLGIAILIGLGGWQLERREWKRQLLATIAERQDQPALHTIPTLSPDYNVLDYRRAELTGLVDESKTVFLGPRTFNERAGYHLLAPMYLADGKAILVNEGFVPTEWAVKQYQAPHVQTLSGTLRLPPLPGPFTPVNPPIYDAHDGDKFYWIDLLAIGQALSAPHLLPVVFDLDRTGEQYPIGGQGVTDIPNDHLQYALTWFALAGALLVVFLIASRRREGGETRDTLHGRKPRVDTDSPSLWH